VQQGDVGVEEMGETPKGVQEVPRPGGMAELEGTRTVPELP
jgi:hypothetical protein